MIDLQKLQKEVFHNKVAQGSDTGDVNYAFGLIHGKLAQACEAFQKNDPALGEEFAEVVIFLLSLAEVLDLNLEKEVIRKVTKRNNRPYEKIDGVVVRTKGYDRT